MLVVLYHSFHLRYSFFFSGDCCFCDCLHRSRFCYPAYLSACSGNLMVLWKFLDDNLCNNSWRSYSATYSYFIWDVVYSNLQFVNAVLLDN